MIPNSSRLIAVAVLTSLVSIAPAVPIITEVVASPANTTGGSTVIIRGLTLAAANLVTIGGSAANITFVTNDTIICTAPPGQGRNLAVQVFEPGGSGNVVNTFSYDIPRISNLSIATASSLGGETLTITGSNFGTSRTVTIGGTLANPTGVNTHTQIQVIVPPGQGSNRPVVVNCAGQTNIAAETPSFGTQAPVLFQPFPRTFSAGTPITINGQNLGPNPAIFIDGLPVPLPNGSHSGINVVIPQGAGINHSISVVAGDQTSNTVFFDYPRPTLNNLASTTRSTAGGYEVTINGTNLGRASDAVIIFDGQTLPTTGPSGNTSLKFIAPPGVGAGKVVTVNTLTYGLQTSTNSLFFSYDPPIINSVTPSNFEMAGGHEVTILGSNFGTAGSVTINDRPATVTRFGHNGITCIVPPSTAPQIAFVRVSAGNQSSNNFQAFYVCPADFNNDGSVDFFDYLDFVAAFSTPC